MRVVTFGEIMLRLAPENYLRFVQADRLEATFGGAEANVAVSLANFGDDVSFVSKLPSHEIGQSAINSLRKFGVGTSFVARGGERVGIYYCEKGASQRPSKVIYDRAGSAIATATDDDFDWDQISTAQMVPLYGNHARAFRHACRHCLEGCQNRKRKGITVSCDLNFRKNFGARKSERSYERDLQVRRRVYSKRRRRKDVFGIEAENTDIESGKLNEQGYVSVARQLVDKFGFKAVAITLRESISANDNNWSGMLYADGKAVFSRKYAMHIVDRVGGGDSFGAGLIHSLLAGKTRVTRLNLQLPQVV